MTLHEASRRAGVRETSVLVRQGAPCHETRVKRGAGNVSFFLLCGRGVVRGEQHHAPRGGKT